MVVLECERELNVVTTLHLELDGEDAGVWHNEWQAELATGLDGDGVSSPGERLLQVELHKFLLLLPHTLMIVCGHQSRKLLCP